MLSESHFPEMWTDFFLSLVYPNHGARFRFSFTFAKVQHFSRICKCLLNFLLFFNIFFIIHYVYYTISNYPEIFLQPRKYFSLVREILWV